MPDIIANIGRKHALAAIFTCGSAFLIPSSLDARERQQPRPEIFTKLLACRDVADAKTRLACYDSQVSAMASASDNDEVVVLDKEELNKTRRSLFGFAFPRLPFLGGGDDGDDGKGSTETQIKEISAKIDRAISLGYGKWEFKLDDGSAWQTTEEVAGRTPRGGLGIVIKRAAMGGFMARIEDWRTVRIKRVG